MITETEEESFKKLAGLWLRAMYDLGVNYQIQFPTLQNIGPVRHILTEFIRSSKRDRLPIPLEVQEATNSLNEYFAELFEIGVTHRLPIEVREYGIFDDTPEEDAVKSAASVMGEEFAKLAERRLQSPSVLWKYLTSNGYVKKQDNGWGFAQNFLEAVGQIQTGSYTIRVLRLFAQGREQISSPQLMEMVLIPEYTGLKQYSRLTSNMRHQGHLETVGTEERFTIYGITEKGRQHYQKYVNSLLSTQVISQLL
ncbi:MAG: hypothetical protein AABW61_02330 [Candidatus Aenigmatarchaeota archaeon]